MLKSFDELRYTAVSSSANIVITSGADRITINGGTPYLWRKSNIYVFISQNMKFKLTNPNNDYFCFGFNNINGNISTGQQFGCISSISKFATESHKYQLMASGTSLYIIKQGSGVVGNDLGTTDCTLTASIISFV